MIKISNSIGHKIGFTEHMFQANRIKTNRQLFNVLD